MSIIWNTGKYLYEEIRKRKEIKKRGRYLEIDYDGKIFKTFKEFENYKRVLDKSKQTKGWQHDWVIDFNCFD